MGGGAGGPSDLTSSSIQQALSSFFSNSTGSSSSSSSTTYPSYVLPYAQQFLSAMAGLAMPNGQIAASPYPYAQVAPYTVPQEQAAQAIGAYGATSPLTAGAEQQQAKTIAGQYVNPNTNPALGAYSNAAADQMIQQYKYATDPSLLAKGAQTGTLDSSAMVQQNQLARYNLGNNLANLNAGIYEPAYQFERQQQQSASQNTPSLVQSQYIPAQQMWQLGMNEQAQAQNVMNQAYGNLQNVGLWPYQALGFYGSALGPAAGPGSSTSGSTTSTGGITGGSTSSGSGSSTVPNSQQSIK